MKLGNSVKFLQAGGPMPAEGLDPTAMLLQAAQLAVLGQDCLMAMQVCQMVIEAIGASAPQETAPAPALEEPVYRKGGRLLKRIKA